MKMKEMKRIDLINNEDIDKYKPRWWKFEYLGDRIALSYATGTLKQIQSSTLLASTLVATELTEDDYKEGIR